MSELNKYIEQLNSPDSQVRREAAEILGEMGDNIAISPLIALLKDSNKGVQQAVIDSLVKIRGENTVKNIIPLLADDDVGVRNTAVEILQQIGNDDIDAIVKELKSDNNDVRKFATDLLGLLSNKKAVEPLIKAVSDSDHNVRVSAVTSLGMLKDKRALGVLINSLNDEEWIKFAAIEALAEIGDRSAVEPLLIILNSGNQLIISAVIESLGHFKDPSSIKPLLKYLKSKNKNIRNLTIKTLCEISEYNKIDFTDLDRNKLFTFLRDALNDDNPDIQDCAVRWLARLKDVRGVEPLLELATRISWDFPERLNLITDALISMGNIPLLLRKIGEVDKKGRLIIINAFRGLRDPSVILRLQSMYSRADEEERFAIISAAGKIGTDEAVEILTKALHDSNGHVRREASSCLGRLKEKENIPILLSIFEGDHYHDVRETAMKSLANIGTHEVFENFIKFLSSANPEIRELAVEGLRIMQNPECIEPIQKVLNDPNWRVRKAAINTISQFNNQSVIENIITAMSDENEHVRLAAVQSISRFSGDRVVKAIITALYDGDIWVRFQAAEILGNMKEMSAIDDLVKKLSDDDPVKIAAAKALGEIGDSGALAALESLKGNNNPDVANAASIAIKHIQTRIDY